MSGNGRLWGRMRLRVLQAQARISWKIFLFYRYHCFQGQVMWYFREGESFQGIRWAFFSLSIITMCSPLKDLSYQSLIEGMSEYRDLEPDSPELKFLGVFFFFLSGWYYAPHLFSWYLHFLTYEMGKKIPISST